MDSEKASLIPASPVPSLDAPAKLIERYPTIFWPKSTTSWGTTSSAPDAGTGRVRTVESPPTASKASGLATFPCV